MNTLHQRQTPNVSNATNYSGKSIISWSIFPSRPRFMDLLSWPGEVYILLSGKLMLCVYEHYTSFRIYVRLFSHSQWRNNGQLGSRLKLKQWNGRAGLSGWNWNKLSQFGLISEIFWSNGQFGSLPIPYISHFDDESFYKCSMFSCEGTKNVDTPFDTWSVRSKNCKTSIVHYAMQWNRWTCANREIRVAACVLVWPLPVPVHSHIMKEINVFMKISD